MPRWNSSPAGSDSPGIGQRRLARWISSLALHFRDQRRNLEADQDVAVRDALAFRLRDLGDAGARGDDDQTRRPARD
jgi:hypothetical protein